MGYDSRIYVVEKHGFQSKEKEFASIIAMFEMCKFPALRDTFKKETDCYVYSDDGNTPILKDSYGEPLKEATVQKVIDVLEEQLNKGETYRRIYPLLAMLKEIQKNEKAWRNITVLHFGD